MGGDQENASRLVADPNKTIDVGRFKSVLTANIGSCPSDLKENIRDVIKSLQEMEKKANQGKLSVTQEQEEDEEDYISSEEDQYRSAVSSISSCLILSIDDAVSDYTSDHVVDEDDDNDDDEDEAVYRIDPTAPESIIRCNEAADDVIIHCTVCNSQMKQQKSRRSHLSFKAVRKFLKKPFRRPVKKKMKHKNMAGENCLQVSSQETKGKKKCCFVQSLKKFKKKFKGKRKAESTASNDNRIVSETFHSVDSPTIEKKWTFQPGEPFGQRKTSRDRSDSVFLIPEGDDGMNEPINKDEQNEKTFHDELLKLQNQTITPVMKQQDDGRNEPINKDEQNEKTFHDELLKLENQTITPLMKQQAVESIDNVKPQNDQKISPRCRKRCSFSEHDLQLLKSIGNIIQFLCRKHSNKFQDDDFGEDDLEFPFKRDGSFRHVMSAKHHEFRKRFGNIGKHYTQEFLHRVFTEETIIEYGLNRNQLCLGTFENLPDALVRVETAIPGYKVSKVCENLKEVCQHEVVKYIIDSISEDYQEGEMV